MGKMFLSGDRKMKTTSLSNLFVDSKDTKIVDGIIDRSKLSNKDFMKVLLTQLTYQDPTDTTDINQFITNLVNLQQMETFVKFDESVKALRDYYKYTNFLNAASFINKKVEYLGNNVEVQKDSNGPYVNLNFKVNTFLQKINIQITDSNGNIVYSDSFNDIKYGENNFKIHLPDKFEVSEGQILHVSYSGVGDQNQIITEREKLALISKGSVKRVNINQDDGKIEIYVNKESINIDDILGVET